MKTKIIIDFRGLGNCEMMGTRLLNGSCQGCLFEIWRLRSPVVREADAIPCTGVAPSALGGV